MLVYVAAHCARNQLVPVLVVSVLPPAQYRACLPKPRPSVGVERWTPAAGASDAVRTNPAGAVQQTPYPP